MQLTPAAQAPRAVAERYRGRPPTYGRIYRMIINGEVPAKRDGGRWLVDVDALADALGLRNKAAA